MVRWYLVKKEGLYWWQGSGCWGTNEMRGAYLTRADAMDHQPFGASQFRDMTGDEDE